MKSTVTCLRCLRECPVVVYETRGGRVGGGFVCPCGYRAQSIQDSLEGLVEALRAPPLYDEEFTCPVGSKVSWKAWVRGSQYGHYGKVVAHLPPYHDAKAVLGKGSPYVNFGGQIQRVSRNPRYLVAVKRGRWGDAKPRLYSPTKHTIEHPRAKKKAS